MSSNGDESRFSDGSFSEGQIPIKIKIARRKTSAPTTKHTNENKTKSTPTKNKSNSISTTGLVRNALDAVRNKSTSLLSTFSPSRSSSTPATLPSNIANNSIAFDLNNLLDNNSMDNSTTPPQVLETTLKNNKTCTQSNHNLTLPNNNSSYDGHNTTQSEQQNEEIHQENKGNMSSGDKDEGHNKDKAHYEDKSDPVYNEKAANEDKSDKADNNDAGTDKLLQDADAAITKAKKHKQSGKGEKKDFRDAATKLQFLEQFAPLADSRAAASTIQEREHINQQIVDLGSRNGLSKLDTIMRTGKRWIQDREKLEAQVTAGKGSVKIIRHTSKHSNSYPSDDNDSAPKQRKKGTKRKAEPAIEDAAPESPGVPVQGSFETFLTALANLLKRPKDWDKLHNVGIGSPINGAIAIRMHVKHAKRSKPSPFVQLMKEITGGFASLEDSLVKSATDFLNAIESYKDYEVDTMEIHQQFPDKTPQSRSSPAKVSKQPHNASPQHSTPATVGKERFSISFRHKVSDTDTQAPHGDLDDVDGKDQLQCLINLTDDTEDTIIYNMDGVPVNPTPSEAVKCFNVFRKQTTIIASKLEGALQSSDGAKELLQRYGRLLYAIDDRCPKPTTKQRDKFTLRILEGGHPHCGPGSNKPRMVLFFTARKRGSTASSYKNNQMSREKLMGHLVKAILPQLKSSDDWESIAYLMSVWSDYVCNSALHNSYDATALDEFQASKIMTTKRDLNRYKALVACALNYKICGRSPETFFAYKTARTAFKLLYVGQHIDQLDFEE